MKKILLVISYIISVQYSGFCAEEIALQRGSIMAPTVIATYESYLLNNASVPRLMQKHLGNANPRKFAQSFSGYKNPESILQSDEWQNAKKDIQKFYGESEHIEKYLSDTESQMRSSSTLTNKSNTYANNIRGNAAENVMQRYHVDKGWTPMDGKIGRQGFDGLFIKRDITGNIVEWSSADAKSGNAQLQHTKYKGKQGSSMWNTMTLEELLAKVEAEYAKSPTAENRNRIADIKRMQTITPTSFKFSQKIVFSEGVAYLVFENTELFSAVGSPEIQTSKIIERIPIRLDGKNLNPTQRSLYKDWLKNVNTELLSSKLTKGEVYNFMKEMRADLRSGAIKTDSELSTKLVKLFNGNRNAVSELKTRIGLVPTYENIAHIRPNVMSFAKGGGYSMLLATGYVVAFDILSGNISTDTAKNASIVSGIALGVYSTERLAIRFTMTETGAYLAKKLIPSVATGSMPRLAGGGVAVAAGVAFIAYDTYQYSQGNISGTRFLVSSGSMAVATGVGIFLTFTETGAAVGTAILPGLGSGAGATIGAIAGICAAVGSGGYIYFEEKAKIADMVAEQKIRSSIDFKHKNETINRRINFLEELSNNQHKEALNLLNSLKY